LPFWLINPLHQTTSRRTGSAARPGDSSLTRQGSPGHFFSARWRARRLVPSARQRTAVRINRLRRARRCLIPAGPRGVVSLSDRSLAAPTTTGCSR